MSKRIVNSTNFNVDSLNRFKLVNDGGLSRFDALNGSHTYQNAVPEGCVLYPVRKLGRGQVLWFNFRLAKEMGLISENHPEQLSDALEKKLIETFSLQIVNEFDQARGLAEKSELLAPQKYMATRYLQLQHKDKRGLKSGDGRSIWNGQIEHLGTVWDVSSRGTGVTCLSPGSAEAGRHLQTGSEEFGYGCGLADTNEMLGSALFSEIFHGNGIPTERVLTVIDLGKGVGIGVRAAPNLLRPAHFFLWLKQGERDILTRSFDQFIKRQIQNRKWNFSFLSKSRYQRALNEIAHSLGRFAATLERRYIFAWLDWDGDNLLADAGIIDYGSIRQFGLRHDQYRYDDVDRYSTNLNEQKNKARLTVQVFAQMVHFIESGKKKPLKHFKNSSACRVFDVEFERHKLNEFARELGLTQDQFDAQSSKAKNLLKVFYKSHLQLESIKVKGPLKQVPDGVNRAPVWNMRKVLRELCQRRVQDWSTSFSVADSYETLLDVARSRFAKRQDFRTSKHRDQLWARYLELFEAWTLATFGPKPAAATLHQWKTLVERANLEGRITGNGSEYILDEVFKARKRGTPKADIQAALEHYIDLQCPFQKSSPKPRALSKAAGSLLTTFVNLSLEHEEDI